MKRLTHLTIGALVSGVLVFGTLPAWSQGENPPDFHSEPIEQQVRALHAERWQAALKDDTGFLERKLADQYSGVAADGHLRTKAETITALKSGILKYEAVNEGEVGVNTYGDDAAIVNSTASVKGTIQGRPVNGDYRATSMYVKEHGDWREVAFQLTPVATEPGPATRSSR